MAHRGYQTPHHDRPADGGSSPLPRGESGQHRHHHVVQRKPARGMQLGRKADLGVDDVIGGEVGHALEGDPVQRLGCLHDRDGVGERFQVAHQ